MATTIQVEKPTKQLLDEIKRRTQAPSMDRVIRGLAEKELVPSRDLFGSRPTLKSFKRDPRDFHEL